MAESDWPQCPEIRGRPLDTALLLNRDHVTDVRDRLRGGYDDHGHVPGEVILPLLDNIDTFYDALDEVLLETTLLTPFTISTTLASRSVGVQG